MWIRTPTKLVKVDTIYINVSLINNKHCIIGGKYGYTQRLGEFNNEKEALRALQHIQNAIANEEKIFIMEEHND